MIYIDKWCVPHFCKEFVATAVFLLFSLLVRLQRWKQRLRIVLKP